MWAADYAEHADRGGRTGSDSRGSCGVSRSAPSSSYNGRVKPDRLRGPAVPSLEEARAALTAAIATEPDVVAAYLFGSLPRGQAGPLSDVDVALLVVDPGRAEDVQARTVDALCRRLETSRVDVVMLTDSPIPLRYRVVREGMLVACRDAAVLEQFITRTVLQYLDFKPLRDRAFGRVRQAILETP